MCPFGKMRESKWDEDFLRLLAAAERNPSRKRKLVHFLRSLLSKGNDAGVAALDSFPSSIQHLSSLCASSDKLEQDEGPKEAPSPCHMRPGGC